MLAFNRQLSVSESVKGLSTLHQHFGETTEHGDLILQAQTFKCTIVFAIQNYTDPLGVPSRTYSPTVFEPWSLL